MPTLHHAEKIKGENRELIDRELGIYLFDDLVVLRTAQCPAVLFESGVIINPYDDFLVKSHEYRTKVGSVKFFVSGVSLRDADSA